MFNIISVTLPICTSEANSPSISFNLLVSGLFPAGTLMLENIPPLKPIYSSFLGGNCRLFISLSSCSFSASEIPNPFSSVPSFANIR